MTTVSNSNSDSNSNNKVNNDIVSAISSSFMVSNVNFQLVPLADSSTTTTTTTTTIYSTSHNPSHTTILGSLKKRWDSVLIGSPIFRSPVVTPSAYSTTTTTISSSTHGEMALHAVAQAWWDRIVALHCQDHRHYHTLMHLYEMMGYLDLFLAHYTTKNNTNHIDCTTSTTTSTTTTTTSTIPTLNTCITILAIFFHDAIYNPKSGTNEEDSSKLFQQFCQDMHCPPFEPWVEAVTRYIMCTKNHKIVTRRLTQTQQLDDSDDASNLALFLDFDMSVLGKLPSAYLHYAGLIRREYSFVERSVYCDTRARVLETFLNQSHIFVSPILRDALESQARENLRLEILLLQSSAIPGQEASYVVE